jgi:hypothetical protein
MPSRFEPTREEKRRMIRHTLRSVIFARHPPMFHAPLPSHISSNPGRQGKQIRFILFRFEIYIAAVRHCVQPPRHRRARLEYLILFRDLCLLTSINRIHAKVPCVTFARVSPRKPPTFRLLFFFLRKRTSLNLQPSK